MEPLISLIEQGLGPILARMCVPVFKVVACLHSDVITAIRITKHANAFVVKCPVGALVVTAEDIYESAERFYGDANFVMTVYREALEVAGAKQVIAKKIYDTVINAVFTHALKQWGGKNVMLESFTAHFDQEHQKEVFEALKAKFEELEAEIKRLPECAYRDLHALVHLKEAANFSAQAIKQIPAPEQVADGEPTATEPEKGEQ